MLKSTTKSNIQIPAGLRPHFQEYDPDALSIAKDSNLIMQRTLEFGTWDEIRWLFEVYHAKKLRVFVRHYGQRLLRPPTFNYWRKLLGIQRWTHGRFPTAKGELWRH